MVNITNENNSVVFQIDDSQVLSFPMNELSVLTEEVSDIVMFKTAKNFKTVVQERWEEITINGEPITKENVIDKFNEIANTNEGGTKINAGTNITLQEEDDGSITISATGELGGTVAWADVTDKPSTFAPSAHTHLSADITDLQGKLDAKQDTLVSGTNIKTINGQDILGEGNITIEGGTGDVTQQYVDEQLALKVDKTAYEADKATFALKTEIPSVEGLASKEELKNGLDEKQDKGDYALKSELSGKQDTLVSGTNIKTINGNSLLGEGNIEIQGGGSGISDAPSDNKLYGRKNANWSEIIIPSTDNFATKSEIADMLTKTEAASTYQPKGEYLTEVPSEYVTETELSGKGYATTSQLDSKLDIETYNSDKATFATKAELADKANTSDLSNYLQTSVAESTYAKKSEIPEEYTLPIATADLLGGIKVGAGLSINAETGVLSATGGGTADSVDWANITSKPDDIVNITDKLAEKLDVSTYNSDKATFATKEELAGKANSSDLSNYLTTSVAESTYAKESSLEELKTSKLDVSTYNQDKETFALKTEIPNDYLTDADLTDYLTKDEASDTYRQKKIINFNRTNRSTEITNAWANSLNNIGATFQYVSFDEGATYNNVLYCGYRSYDGAGNRKGVGITEIDGKMRSVIFEFSGIDCVATLEDEIDLSDYATKEELNLKANTSDLSNYVTTVNAEATYAKKSEIPSLEGYLQTSTADEKYATKAELEGKVDNADIADMLTKTEASSTYQPIGDYLTEVPAEYITESELNAKGYKKIEYLTQTQYDELPTKEEGVLYVITDAPEVVIPDTSTFATKAELEGKADKTSVPVAQQEYEEGDNTKYIYAANSYQNKTFNVIADFYLSDNKELKLFYKWWGRPNNSEAVSIRNASQSLDGAMSAEDKTKLDSINVETLATKDELSAKQDTLVSGTNIKTINGESILGSGDIEIQGGSSQVFWDLQTNSGNTEYITNFYNNVKVGDAVKYNNVYNNNLIISISKNSSYEFVNCLLSPRIDDSSSNPNQNKESIWIKATSSGTLTEGYFFPFGIDSYYNTIELRESLGAVILDISEELRTKINDSLSKTEATSTYKTIASEWYGTQSEYDLITEKDPNVTYYITEG